MSSRIDYPRCRRPLLEARADDFVAAGCKRCGGLWLDNAQSQKVVSDLPAEALDLARSVSHASEQQVDTAPEDLACPQCGDPLARTASIPHHTIVSADPRTTQSCGVALAVNRILASSSAALVIGLGLAACSSSTPPTTVEPPQLSSGGSIEASPPTPGSVVCGPHRCPAGREVCCHFAQGPACVPVTPPNRPYGPAESAPSECEMGLNNPPTARVACDDSSDCPDETRCCVDESGSACLLGLCEAYERCDPDHPGCREGSCVRGSAPHLSACRIPAGPVACAALTCPTTRPVCCLHDDGQRRCVASPSDCLGARSEHRPWGHPFFSFACDGPDDCAPNTPCCAAGRSYQCSQDCPTPAPDGRLPFICTQDGDCPPHPQGTPATCSSLQLLDPSSPPPYVSFCDYEDDTE